MVNHYEAAFILTPVLSDVQMKEAVGKFKEVLTENGATIENEELWGLKKLAYAIDKKSTGFYAVLQFSGEPTLVEKLETQFRRDERVIRFLVFKLDKYAYEYASRRVKKNANAPQEVVAEVESKTEEK
ncbi:MAG: 30S ribosomal protein S6 [Bacteroidales bacterium]|nr:MAG: 30S ribosomal protein S6 [Bacteroidales bacterium]